MSTAINQKAYLQKYLTGRSSDKKKKKKKLVKGKGFKIIDDDLDLTKLRPLGGDELDILNEGEDAPQVVGIIDERPEEIRKLEDFKTSSKWRVINQDDGFNSKLQIEEVKRDNKEVEKENEIVFGKMYSDSEDDKKYDSDPSPPRKNSEKNKKKSTSKGNQDSDSDVSPPRRNDKSKNRNYDSDPSPPRNSKKSVQNKDRNNRQRDIEGSPQRRGNSSSWMNKNDDSDESPPRKRPKKKTSTANRNYDTQLSPPRKTSNNKIKRERKPSRWGNFDDTQSRRSKSRETSPNGTNNRSHTPDKNNRKKINSDTSSYKPRSNDYDSDLSPPRKSRRQSPKSYSQDSDLSPRRRKKEDKYDKYKNNDRKNFDKRRGASPKNKRSDQFQRQDRRTERNESDSDLSPPRREKSKNHSGRDYRNDEPPPSNKKMEKTLEGKKAGLQDAGQLKEENRAFRRREEEAFKHMTDEMSGRNAKAVSRKSKRDTSQDKQMQREKAERQKELDEKYKKWSKGIKQVEDQQAAVQDFIHEASKPLARYKDDRDLEDQLRDVERAGDPMLKYIREKKREKGELGPEKPIYKGNFPPNRFNIRPGYRWDGVDRSNGYEKKYFDQQSKRKAQEEEVYKWSTEDL
ncbi:BUD13 homolog [Nymphalis io]|uniref:BUD13 homolog n=1 Tax=Inachis io TaxID=171585 RepID=UPI0021682AF4|nr:BUD13 homolog [Nymphalis io]